MRNSRAKTIHGLSIAVVILSILGLIGSVLALAIFAIGGFAAFDPTVQSSVSASLAVDPGLESGLEYYDLSTSDAMGIVGILMGIGGIYMVWAIICSVISLVAGIVGMRNCDNIQKLGSAFGWAIAGAIVSFLYGNLVICILLIISAVCISKDRKESTAIPYGQPAAYTQMPPYGAAPQPPQHGAAPKPPAGQPQPPQPTDQQ